MSPASPRLTDSERLDWLRLIRTENVGPIAFRQLLRRFGGAAAALAALPDLGRRSGRAKPMVLGSRAAAEQELMALAKLGAHVIALNESAYPPALAAIDTAPPLLFARGRIELLARPCVALVGARNASANGRRLAEDMARELGAAGYVVVSGLARGIDHAAHRGSLSTGTVAAVAGGIDVTYPPDNEALQRAIEVEGVVVSEMPVGAVPRAMHFPRRNRIISGLALGVVVVEAALQSGSLITARYALEQGREVMAVPGSPLDPRCRGANSLLKDGAILVESGTEVAAALAAMTPAGKTTQTNLRVSDQDIDVIDEYSGPATLSEVEAQLSPEPVSVDELVRQCQLSAPAVRAALLELELAGRLERHPGNRVSLLLTVPAHRS